MALRRLYAGNHPFGIENTGHEPVFSDYLVTNPENKNSYKVSIRDNHHSFHFCSCYDFKANGLGTCKHIEAAFRVLATPCFHKTGEPRTERAGEFENFLQQAKETDPSFRCYPDALEYILELRDEAIRRKLAVALSKPESTRQLVDSIVAQDPADGRTYLKIPVESRQTVENIIGLIGTFHRFFSSHHGLPPASTSKRV